MFSLQHFSTDEIIFFGREVFELVWKHHLEERKEKQLDSDFFFGFFFYLWGGDCVCLKSARAKKQTNKKPKQNKNSRYFVSVVVHKAENVKQGYNR